MAKIKFDKLQGLKEGLCLDNVDPATASALNGLVDNIIDTLKPLSSLEFPNLGSNLGDLPGLAPFDFPLGKGSVPDVRGPGLLNRGGGPLSSPPGGGGGGEGGGDDGGGGEGGGFDFLPCIACAEGIPGVAETVIMMGTADTEITAAGEDGKPGEGIFAEEERLPDGGGSDACRAACHDHYDDDIKELREALRNLDTTNMTPEEAAAARQKLDLEIQDKMLELAECLNNCPTEVPQPTGAKFTVRNISCEKIEKGTKIIVGGSVCYVPIPPERKPCRPWIGGEDLWVLVEACGCD